MTLSAISMMRLAAAALIVAAGIFLRSRGLHYGASPFWVKYGGSILWAAMYYFVFAVVSSGSPREQVLFTAGLFCALIECLKLVHAPALDAFRATPAGPWLLGRIFSGWNFVAYAVGLFGAWVIDGFLEKISSRGR